jgi:hypothetical protein
MPKIRSKVVTAESNRITVNDHNASIRITKGVHHMITTTMAGVATMPKSYLSAETREELLREGDLELVYLAESYEADQAGDGDAAWAWLAHVILPAHTLLFLKWQRGASFIREKGFATTEADAKYGPDWLDREDL